MLMLDTNMLSEIMRPEPERKVADWIVRQPSDELFTAAVCQAEILSGLGSPSLTPATAEMAAAAQQARSRQVAARASNVLTVVRQVQA
ncbi:MAG: PIN domain-containing protein [Acetobacteraceae bacterium]|nr:PIN domain-containing protein [Acetobacteraceae bacterium]